ncbi:ATP-binding protein involved in chromosome partitioning [Paenibacillus cellulosilyticus]|uniref:Iron-sulfur cluster carrier protein n=1 Tax=Paenibacillus cellulosilyticus TaxID=375489 RepID=A0A2V2YMC1_9BACL|nr:Mrp/NBP35 family ATP-binding protein [Paenibacillus cellulosilyticus]PWV94366.1 ATP-binding protein involved in chromosome partitioning [Paenibacillus cellulosilyticus]QKS47806.1 P-loop NTPase [Paenibacillus cellulosilyticus]
MLTRDEVIEIVRKAVDGAGATGQAVQFRDVVWKDNNLSMTVLTAKPEDQTPVEAVVRDALKVAGIESVHLRFRELPPEVPAASAQSNGEQGQGAPVKGHGGLLEPTPLLSPESGTKFIAIASGKGGVGKSTVTVNLAVALARAGKRVGLIDADIYGFSVPDMMGIEERPDVEGDRVIPIERFGVKVMSMGFFVENNSPVVWRGPMLGKMLRNFFAEIEWGELDYMLLDLPPGTGDIALDVHQIIPQSQEIIVTTPHATAAFVAARAGAMAIKTEHAIIGVVENMSYYMNRHSGEKEYLFGRGGGARLAETLNAELLAQIPLGAPDNHPSEPDFSPSVYKADSETGMLYAELAQRVIAKV